MKKFLFTLALLLAALPTFAQQAVNPKPDCILPFTFTAAGNTGDFDNRPKNTITGFQGGCTTWTLMYNSVGFSVDSLEFQGAPDATGVAGTYATWTILASGTTLPLTATTFAQATGYRYQPWVRVKANTLTGTGTVNGVLMGWRPLSGQDSNSATGASYTTDSSGRLITNGPTADGGASSGVQGFPMYMLDTGTNTYKALNCTIQGAVCIPRFIFSAAYTASETVGTGNAGQFINFAGSAVNHGVFMFGSNNLNGTAGIVAHQETYSYPLTTSATNTAQTIIIDMRGTHDTLAIHAVASAGTFTLTVEMCTDSTCTTSPLTIDSIAAAATQTKQYTATTVGATVALSPLAARWVRVTAGTAGVGNTTTLRMYAK